MVLIPPLSCLFVDFGVSARAVFPLIRPSLSVRPSHVPTPRLCSHSTPSLVPYSPIALCPSLSPRHPNYSPIPLCPALSAPVTPDFRLMRKSKSKPNSRAASPAAPKQSAPAANGQPASASSAAAADHYSSSSSSPAATPAAATALQQQQASGTSSAPNLPPLHPQPSSQLPFATLPFIEARDTKSTDTKTISCCIAAPSG
jgi:hypothetical protein